MAGAWLHFPTSVGPPVGLPQGKWREGARSSAGLALGGGEGEGGLGVQEAGPRVQGDPAGGAGQGEEEEGT